MKINYKVLLCLIFSLMLFFSIPFNTAKAFELQLQSKAALLMEAYTGEIILAVNEHEKLYPASVTKIMTLLLALEALERGDITLKDVVTVSENASSFGGSTLFLSPGDQVDLESLLIGIAVGSGNDASVALAEHLAGSEEAFVERMNNKAAEMGMKNTNFVNCTGLHHAEHYTTAYDVALMSREIIKYPRFFSWSKIWMDENFLEGKIKSGKVFLSNTNRLIRYYRDCDGIKTGYTAQSGHSISATAERDGTRFIAVVLNAPSSDIRYEEARSLLDFGFTNYYTVTFANKKEKIATLPVEKGVLKEVDVVTAEMLSLLVKKGEEQGFKTEIDLPRKLKAPLYQENKVGKMMVLEGEKVLKEVDLEVSQEIEKASLLQLFRRYLEIWLKFGR